MEAQEEEWQPITYSLIALKLWNSNGVSDFYGLQALGVLSYNIIRSIHSK